MSNVVCAARRRCCLGLPLLLRGGLLPFTVVVAELLPAKIQTDVVLTPGQPYTMKVSPGSARLVQFSCHGVPADVVLSFTSLNPHLKDPLLFLWLGLDEPPSISNHMSSSFEQWREDELGSHYVRAEGVGPRGGLVGIVNPKEFAGENIAWRPARTTATGHHWQLAGGEISGVLSLHCADIAAFDTLFWDHLRDSYVCPLGDASSEGGPFCSGHGRCGKYGACECAVGFTGAACQNAKSDILHVPQRRYSFDLGTGRYHYFRLRVPPSFSGGFLEVAVKASGPLVVLISESQQPTKTRYQLSNFDDWINKRKISKVKFKVEPGSKGQGGIFPGTSMKPRGVLPKAPGQVPPGVSAAAGRNEVAPSALPANLSAPCPRIIPEQQAAACGTAEVMRCETRCMDCIQCNNTKSEDDRCATACVECTTPKCISAMAECAARLACTGPEAEVCASTCGGCMMCLDSNDELCGSCRCCQSCLPVAAKCGSLMQEAEEHRFVYVGVLNHRWYYSEKATIHADVSISLEEDASYSREPIPSSWIANLYDPFHDIRSLEEIHRDDYPEDERFMYHLQLHGGKLLRKTIRLYRDRLTLLAIDNPGREQRAELNFRAGPNVTHVLYSSRVAPKTLFDFDQVPVQVWGHTVRIGTKDRARVWCALFGGIDGELEIIVRSTSAGGKANVGFALVCVPTLLCSLLVLGALCSNTRKVHMPSVMVTSPSMEPATSHHESGSAPLSERIAQLMPSVLRSHRSDHSGTAPLNRNYSQGYFGSETIPLSVEEQYLHRGGFGDDGM